MLSHGLNLLTRQSPPTASLLNSRRSCSLLAWSCQNSIRKGLMRYPPQKGGRGMAAVPAYCSFSLAYSS